MASTAATSAPNHSISRVRRLCSDGLYRSMWPTAPISPFESNRSARRWADVVSCARGFSTIAWTPASASAVATGSW